MSLSICNLRTGLRTCGFHKTLTLTRRNPLIVEIYSLSHRPPANSAAEEDVRYAGILLIDTLFEQFRRSELIKPSWLLDVSTLHEILIIISILVFASFILFVLASFILIVLTIPG